ncbi:MAG: RNA polymerase-associated protein RapA [Gammaproteobacteria bacterium]
MSMIPGQRYASATEPDLGLGIAIEVDGRRITVLFPAAEERRVYAMDTSPLSRIEYAIGDHIEDVNERTLRVTGTREADGLLVYRCEDTDGNSVDVPEMDLSAYVQFTTPVQRLANAQIDKSAAYRLRLQALALAHEQQRSPVCGLRGPRVSLLPHQLYIADTVARRYAPRVLLADEVGLGKTIEAGMIVHHQLETGRAQRVLVLVPDALVYQWLVEMLRRFNLRLALFDEPRFEALLEEGIAQPFDAEQHVLCSLDLLASNEAMRSAALTTDWDLVIVDEAHHLKYAPDVDWGEDTAVDAYRTVEQLAALSKGLLLLTATPEQLGADSHFARLRLLDPARFFDLKAFQDEQQRYQKLNEHIEPLLHDDTPLDAAQRAEFERYVDRELPADMTKKARHELLRELLDRHGTGRILFRNTRAAVPDFPQREAHIWPLPDDTPPVPFDSVEAALYPEAAAPDENWTRSDARVAWLVQFLKEDRTRQALVICHHMATAKALDEHLTLREGLRSTSFYEGLSLLERDRAAAYFADGQIPGNGAQVLVCSEIGSEGRNFQFAHHMVLFDLPLSPDLLEQRIGRLDRIGQTSTIHIHVPVIENSPTQVLLRWHHEGLNALAHSAPGAQSLFAEFEAELRDAISAPSADATPLIERTRERAQSVGAALRNGRDRLIELNSCDNERAATLVHALEEDGADQALPAFLAGAFEHFGVEQEDDVARTMILRPSEKLSAHLPGLTEDGLTATYDRNTALMREDLHFMTAEHPIAKEALALVLHGDVGNATLSTLALKALPAGTLLLEAWFTVAVIAPAALQIERYLSLSPTRFLIAANGKDVGATLDAKQLDRLCKDVDRKTARAVLGQVRGELNKMVAHAKDRAQEVLPGRIDEGAAIMRDALGNERDRLETLARLNPNVRAEEIEHVSDTIRQCEHHIGRAQMRLSALRLIVNTGGK